MSTDAAVAPASDHDAPCHDEINCASLPQPSFLHSPPDTNNTLNKSDASDSELSDLDEEPILSDAPMPLPASDDHAPSEEDKAEPEVDPDDIGEVLPDHWTNGVPVFKPTFDQFKDFKRFMTAVDSYGMKSGIIKIVPPSEWKDSLPPIDELVKRVKVREPIKQDIMGFNGTYRQVNILHGRSYNLPQWRQLCEQSEHQPPARRGERRANADKPKPRTRAAAASPANPSTPKKRTRGRAGKKKQTKGKTGEEVEAEDRPMTPVSPKAEPEETQEKALESIENDPGVDVEEDADAAPRIGRMGAVRPAKSKTQSVSARRKYSRREGSAMIDEAAFKDWDYRMDISDYTPERCEELERVYWKTLTYAPPLYGADLMGTLFEESTEQWNLNKLPNLLDVIGTKVPGVNTAYLYLGMWKATFAWHLEDVDLYSINYLHFGAPKQWYSISQADARRFENAMKSIWPADAKACDQFLRHKAFLISPQHLLSHYGIKVNKCVTYPGEFVVTYPYGYHSGYNLGYNCAEAVNFALDSWLDMGKIAKKCECAQAQDSVWVNVYEIERKLRGEETEYEETEDEDEEEDEDDEMSGLPTPPASHGVKFKDPSRKRKRGVSDRDGKTKVKKIKLRIKAKVEPPCCLCPNDIPAFELLPTNDGRKAHRMCALYLPETFIDTVEGQEVVVNVNGIHKDRLELKCLYCRSKRGACFQCSQKKCARAYHPTCAAAAGVFVEEQDVPVFGEDGTEYKEQAFEFSCRFHRTKRDRKLDGDSLERDSRIQAAASTLKKGEVCQMQYQKGEIFAGVVVENRIEERTLLLDILPNGDRIEVEWKWLLLPDPSDYHLPKASAKAIPMPTSQKARDELNAKRQGDDKPRKDDIFVEGYTWAEFQMAEVQNKDQVKIDFAKQDQIWFYLGNLSTEGRAQYTEDPSKPRNNPRGNFLNTIPKPPRPALTTTFQRPYVPQGGFGQFTTPMTPANAPSASARPEKPYVYKPRKPLDAPMGLFATQRYTPMAGLQQTRPMYPQHSPATNFQYRNISAPQMTPHQMPAHQMQPSQPTMPQHMPAYSNPRFEVKPKFFTPHQHMAQIQAAQAQNIAARPVHQQQWLAQAAAHQQAHQSPHQQFQQPLHQPQQPRQPSHESPQQPTHQPQQPHQPAAVVLQTPSQTSYLDSRPVPRPQSKPSWQVHPSIYQKYEFFKINHNRESSKYRTPYSPMGGFTNGYEGNLRAHLMENQSDLLRRSSVVTSAGLGHGAGPMGSYHSLYNQRAGAVSQPQTSPPQAPPPQIRPYIPRPQPPHQASPPSWMQLSSKGSHPHLPPAIKPRYLPPTPQARAAEVNQVGVQQQQSTPPAAHPTQSLAPVTQQLGLSAQTPVQPPQPKPSPKSSPGHKTNMAPPKESPVPLPANFLAAMNSTTTPTSTPKPLAQTSPARTVSGTAKSPSSKRLQHATGSPAKPGSLPKISTTPVPIPRLPGMSQHAPTSQFATGKPLIAPGGQLQGLQQEAVSSVPQQELPKAKPQEFPDVPGCESMEFVERLMANLRKASQRPTADGA